MPTQSRGHGTRRAGLHTQMFGGFGPSRFFKERSRVASLGNLYFLVVDDGSIDLGHRPGRRLQLHTLWEACGDLAPGHGNLSWELFFLFARQPLSKRSECRPSWVACFTHLRFQESFLLSLWAPFGFVGVLSALSCASLLCLRRPSALWPATPFIIERCSRRGLADGVSAQQR